MIFGKILYISDNIAHVENVSKDTITADLMNIHVIFEDKDQRILGEVIELNIFALVYSYSRYKVNFISLTKKQGALFHYLDQVIISRSSTT